MTIRASFPAKTITNFHQCETSISYLMHYLYVKRVSNNVKELLDIFKSLLGVRNPWKFFNNNHREVTEKFHESADNSQIFTVAVVKCSIWSSETTTSKIWSRHEKIAPLTRIQMAHEQKCSTWTSYNRKVDKVSWQLVQNYCQKNCEQTSPTAS